MRKYAFTFFIVWRWAFIVSVAYVGFWTFKVLPLIFGDGEWSDSGLMSLQLTWQSLGKQPSFFKYVSYICDKWFFPALFFSFTLYLAAITFGLRSTAIIPFLKVQKNGSESIWGAIACLLYPSFWYSFGLAFILLSFEVEPYHSVAFLLFFSWIIATILILIKDGISNFVNYYKKNGDVGQYKKYENWLSSEMPISDPADDLLELSEQIKRYEIKTKNHEHRHIVVDGKFGIGKSSFISLCLNKIYKNSVFHTIQCRVSLLSVSKIEDMNSVVLKKMLNELSHIIDVTPMRGMPENFEYLLKSSDSQLKIIPDILKHAKSDPFSELKKCLRAINCRLVVVLEDIDRGRDSVDALHALAKLIEILRKIDNIQIVLALDSSLQFSDESPSRPEELLSRLIPNYINLLNLSHKQSVSMILNTFTKTLQEAKRNSILFPGTMTSTQSREFDGHRLFNVDETGKIEYFPVSDGPILQCLEMVSTIRELKQVLLNFQQCWEGVKGEVDIEELLIIKFLQVRYRSWDALEPLLFEFVGRNIESGYGRRANLDWKIIQDRLLAENHESVVAAVGFLFSNKFYKLNEPGTSQSIGSRPSGKYLNRLIAGHFDDEAGSDQKLLGLINDFYKDKSKATQIAEYVVKCDAQHEQMRRFGSMISAGERKGLAEAICRKFLDKYGANFTFSKGGHNIIFNFIIDEMYVGAFDERPEDHKEGRKLGADFSLSIINICISRSLLAASDLALWAKGSIASREFYIKAIQYLCQYLAEEGPLLRQLEDLAPKIKRSLFNNNFVLNFITANPLEGNEDPEKSTDKETVTITIRMLEICASVRGVAFLLPLVAAVYIPIDGSVLAGRRLVHPRLSFLIDQTQLILLFKNISNSCGKNNIFPYGDSFRVEDSVNVMAAIRDWLSEIESQ